MENIGFEMDRVATCLTCILHGQGDLRLESRPLPQPGPGQVQVAVQRMGICGTDLSYYSKTSLGGLYPVKERTQLGHEAAGFVTAAGTGVVTLKPGDRVALEPSMPCSVCEQCKEGRCNLCVELKFSGGPGQPGFCSQYVVHPSEYCFKIPDSMSYQEGALVEPVAVGVQGCRRAGVKLGHKVFICGSGPIGLVHMLVAKAMGAAQVCTTDIAEHRLEAAARFGADRQISAKDKAAEQVACEVREALGGLGAHVALECSGTEHGLCSAVYATRPGGVVAMIGIGNRDTKILTSLAIFNEIDIRGVSSHANCFPEAIQLISTGKIDIKELVTKTFSLEQVKQAFQTAQAATEGVIKVHINCAFPK